MFFGSGNAGDEFIFDAPLDITKGGVTVTFRPGTYLFKGGLELGGGDTYVLDSGTYEFGSTSTTPTTTVLSFDAGATVSTQSSGVLLYMNGGSAALSGGSTTTILGEASNLGVALWDAATSSASQVVLTNGTSAASTYGGLYVPHGTVSLPKGNAKIDISFIVTNLLSAPTGSNGLVLGN